jgi:hypothetical protein
MGWSARSLAEDRVIRQQEANRRERERRELEERHLTAVTDSQPTETGLDVATIHSLVVSQDMSKLSPAQQVQYYLSLCEATGLDPRTKPFALLSLNGKLVPYALKAATDQLRAKRGLSITIVKREVVDDLCMVEVLITDGRRSDTEIGAVSIGGLRGDALANAFMKSLTKAKRRATLSFCGLGMLDESELDTIPNARPGPEIRVTTDEPATYTAAAPAETPAAEEDPEDRERRLHREAVAEMKAKPWAAGERERYGAKWTAIYHKAVALGIQPPRVHEWMSRSQVTAIAQATQARIAEAEAAVVLASDAEANQEVSDQSA